MTIQQLVESKLPALAKLIEAHSGIDLKGTKLKVEQITNHRGVSYLQLSSEDLWLDLSPIGRTIFKTFKIEFWGGEVKDGASQIGFLPKVSYTHPGGGSNGTDFIWHNIIFDIETESWIPGNKIGVGY